MKHAHLVPPVNKGRQNQGDHQRRRICPQPQPEVVHVEENEKVRHQIDLKVGTEEPGMGAALLRQRPPIGHQQEVGPPTSVTRLVAVLQEVPGHQRARAEQGPEKLKGEHAN